jgi:hypothetical protein
MHETVALHCRFLSEHGTPKPHSQTPRPDCAGERVAVVNCVLLRGMAGRDCAGRRRSCVAPAKQTAAGVHVANGHPHFVVSADRSGHAHRQRRRIAKDAPSAAGSQRQQFVSAARRLDTRSALKHPVRPKQGRGPARSKFACGRDGAVRARGCSRRADRGYYDVSALTPESAARACGVHGDAGEPRRRRRAPCVQRDAGTGSRTRMALRPRDFKSLASTSFAIPANLVQSQVSAVTLAHESAPNPLTV